MNLCTVADCGRPHNARGWCTTHYERWRRHGDPETVRSSWDTRPRGSPPCTVDGCSSVSTARGLCVAHYTRWRKYGDTSVNKVPRGLTLAERFDLYAVRGDGCWAWTAHHDRRGYARVCAHGQRNYGAYRLAYELFVGPIPARLTIDHLCRNKGCVNPAHLEAVTSAENTRRGALARAGS